MCLFTFYLCKYTSNTYDLSNIKQNKIVFVTKSSIFYIHTMTLVCLIWTMAVPGSWSWPWSWPWPCSKPWPWSWSLSWPWHKPWSWTYMGKSLHVHHTMYSSSSYWREIKFTQRKTNWSSMIRCWFEICMCTK